MPDDPAMPSFPQTEPRVSGCGCGGAVGASCGCEVEAAGLGATSRREFLKIVGVTGAGAAVACGRPVYGDKLIPLRVEEEERVPGISDVYATAIVSGPEPLGLHAYLREGRVIKLEGNPEAPNRGHLSALAHSTLQDLYDPDRVPGPRKRGESGGSESQDESGSDIAAPSFAEAGWDEGIAALGVALQGGGVVLLTGSSPTARDRFFEEWASATGAEHLRWEPLEYESARAASEIAFGRREVPSYHIERADAVACFGADFLGTWLSPVQLAARFSEARDVDHGRHAKLTFVGPRLSVTGLKADAWISCGSGAEGTVALAVAAVVAEHRGGAGELDRLLSAYSPESVAAETGISADAIRALGDELAEASSPIAIPPGFESQGEAATEAHLAVAILNHLLGTIGDRVRFGTQARGGRVASMTQMADLTARMRSGAVRTVIVADTNPAFTLPKARVFADALGRVANRFSLASHLDETAALCSWILPSNHTLESWGEVDFGGGRRAVTQPVMPPVFDTRQMEDVLIESAAAGGAEVGGGDFASLLRDAARQQRAEEDAIEDFDDWWRDTLAAGGLLTESGAAGQIAEQPTLDPAVAAFAFSEPSIPEGTALVVYPTIQFYDGRGANRSWMQEMQDPVTRAMWNSWVEMHPEMAEALGVSNGDLVEVSSESGTLTAPAFVYRGIHRNTVAIPLGQGHTAYGRNARGRGVNPMDLLPGTADEQSGAPAFAGTGVTVRGTGERGRLVILQGNDFDEGREIAEILGVSSALEGAHGFGEGRGAEGHEVDLGALVQAAYDSDPNSPYRWGMTVDLNACTGCAACVTACYAENNIPTVGEQISAQRREMSWIRVDRYFVDTEDGGFQTVQQPLMCQHCGDAPCEPVCPVYATYHNPEGLNAQIYNRCVGTRYCANNCPYKVRRFNWFEYDFPYPLNLQLNPDVTVRQKGVMEKCTFCVQRINGARQQAKAEGRLIRDGDFQTACQQTCPAGAIVFGNLKDADSDVSKKSHSPRGYHVLDEIYTRPAVTYLADVTHAPIPEAGHGSHGEPADEHDASDRVGEEEGH
jgi:molybdopterin-containing oxidoreductase family iron-sulfur binding subunit